MEHRTVHNPGCEIHYWYRQGTGDSWAVFLHGAGLDHAMFEPQFGLFAPAWHLLAWDARGHGLSKLEPGTAFRFCDMVDDCETLLERHGVRRAVLIGQSMGGNLAQEIAYRFPELAEKLVLIDCTRNTGRLTWFEKLALKVSGPIFALYPWEALLRQSAEASAISSEVRRYIADCFRSMGKGAFVSVMRSLTDGCLHEDASYRFRCPVLLLCGDKDRLGNIRRVAAPWAAEDSRCTLRMIRHAGHNSNQDNPAEVNRLIAEFLDCGECDRHEIPADTHSGSVGSPVS